MATESDKASLDRQEVVNITSRIGLVPFPFSPTNEQLVERVVKYFSREVIIS